MSSKLFTPFAIGRMALANRITVAPMCQYSAADGCMTDWHMMHLGSFAVSPVHVVIGMETSFLTHQLAASVSGVNYPRVDIGIAGEHLVLAGTELGLGTCWIGWIRPRVVAEIVGWPKATKPVVVITVGYPHESQAGRLPASRRKPLEDLVKWL